MDKADLFTRLNLSKEELLIKCNKANRNTLMETLGIQFTDVGDDFLVATLLVTPTVHQPMGILHGGATAALAETVGSLASILNLEAENKMVKGVELSINHLKSVKEGIIRAEAKIQHKGRTLHLWEIKVYDEANNLIAISKLSNIVLDKKR